MRLTALAIITAVALLVPAAGASSATSCGRIQAHGFTFNVTVGSGRVSCREARSTMKAFLSGGGTEHGGPSSPSFKKTWTLHGGWRCGFGTGGGGCTRRKPHAVILGVAPPGER
jgi:hypothetical protein